MAGGRILTFCRQNALLTAILTAGFLLRVSGLFWGLPVLDPDAGFYHPDETFIFDLAIFTFGIAAPAEALGYPTFFAALLGLLTLPVRLWLDPSTDYETFLLIVAVAGRACSVAAGTAAIYFTHQLAVELGARRAEALLAAALLTFSLYHAQNSAFGTTDVLTSLFLVLFLLFVRRGFAEGSRRAFVRAGIALGLLVGTKYTGALAVVAVPLFYGYHLLRSWQGHPSSPSGRAPAPSIGYLLLCGVVSVLIFAITTPGPFIHLPSFLQLMQAVASETGWTGTTWNDPAVWSRTYELVVVALGWPLTWLMLFGFVFPLRRSVYHLGATAIVLTLFVYFGRTLYARYVIMVAPLIAVIASHGVMTLYERARHVHLQAVPVVVIVAVLTYSIGYCVVGAYLRHADTRSQAARFLHESFPPGTSVGFGYVSIQRTLHESPRWMNPHADFSAASPLEMPQLATLWDLPPVDFDTFRYVDLLDYPDVVLVSSPVFDQIQAALTSGKLSPDYVWDPRYNAEWYRSLPPEPRVFAFYARLLDPEWSPYTLAGVFSKPMPVPIEFGSPEVRVYVLSPEARTYQRERVALSFANVHYYPPYSTTETQFPADPLDYFTELDTRMTTWSLAVAEGSVARVEFPSDEPQALRVTIDRTDLVTAWHVQLNQVGFPLRQGTRYALNFRARATEPRQIAAAVSRAYGTRENLGLYQFADVGPEWQSFRYEFVATADEASSRIHFDLGRSHADVTVDAVHLHEIDDEGNVVPVVSRPPVYGVQYRFNGMGCRGRDYEVPAPAGVRRVLVLGNSWALGAGVHEEDTLSARLENLLNAEEGTAAGRYEVVNCGVDGYDVRKARQFYELMASRYGANVVLLLVAPRQFDAEVDVARVFVPQVRDDNSGREIAAAPQHRDAEATVDDIVQLAQAVSARNGTLGVLLARGDGSVEWADFVEAVRLAAGRASVRVERLDSFLPVDHPLESVVVLAGVDGRPNHVAHDRAAREVAQLLRDW